MLFPVALKNFHQTKNSCCIRLGLNSFQVDIQNTVLNTLLLHNGSEEQLSKYCPRLAKDMVWILPKTLLACFPAN
jgi:hypothetical protein